MGNEAVETRALGVGVHDPIGLENNKAPFGNPALEWVVGIPSGGRDKPGDILSERAPTFIRIRIFRIRAQNPDLLTHWEYIKLYSNNCH